MTEQEWDAYIAVPETDEMTEQEWDAYAAVPGRVFFMRDADTCAYCEYFDGGGEKLVKLARRANAKTLHGDCLCDKSPRFETKSNQTCDAFFRNTTF